MSVRLFYLSQTSGRVHKPDSQARIRAIGQAGPSGGTAAFRGSPTWRTKKVKFNAGYRPHGSRFTVHAQWTRPRAVVATAAACLKSLPADLHRSDVFLRGSAQRRGPSAPKSTLTARVPCIPHMSRLCRGFCPTGSRCFSKRQQTHLSKAVHTLCSLCYVQ